MVVGYLLPTATTRPILKKILDIGEWNMDADAGKQVIHNLIQLKARRVTCVIRRDDDSHFQILPSADSSATSDEHIQVFPTYIALTRANSGNFDSTDYNATASTVANRGWVNIEYEA